jgi:hypothetical protein
MWACFVSWGVPKGGKTQIGGLLRLVTVATLRCLHEIFFIYIVLIHFAKNIRPFQILSVFTPTAVAHGGGWTPTAVEYTTVSNFISFDHQPPWRTVVAGLQPPWATTVGVQRR